MAQEEGGGPSYREHAALNERVTRLEAGLGHLPAEVARLSRSSEGQAAALHELTRAIHDISKAPSIDPAIGQMALGLHAFADAMKTQASQPPPQQLPPTPVLAQIVTYIGLFSIGSVFGQPLLAMLKALSP